MTYFLRIQLLFILIIMTLQSVHAFIPSVESLFRNASNEEIGEKTVIANLQIKKIPQSDDEKGSVFASKFIFGNYDKNKKFIQVNFNNNSFALSQVSKVIFRDNVSLNNLGLSEENIEGRITYAVLSSLLNNDGTWMIEAIKKLGSDVKSNRDLVNSTKLELLKNYQSYLVKTIADEYLEAPNPLVDKNLENQEKLNEIMDQPFYFQSPKVSQVKVKDSFFWQVTDTAIDAQFDLNTRQIKRLKVKTALGEMEYHFKDFILQNAKHLFPKEILFKDLTGTRYSIKLEKLLVFDDTPDRFRVRLKKYDKELNKNPSQMDFLKPSFLL